tara:strand:+ start:1164 stop:1934 length:771 start_codon:yes stop_codon:yes gene_type:complete
MVDFFSPKSFQFWSNPQARPKRVFEAILVFPDLIFGGDGLQNIEPYLVTSFSRPGYSRIETKTAEYQLRSGDFAKIDYPTQGFQTSPLKVTLLDVVNHNGGANTASAVQASLAMQHKTMVFQEEAAAAQEGEKNDKYDKLVESWKANPRMFFIIELGGNGKSVGQWQIYTPILSSVTFSEINYKNTGFGTIDMIFQYENFKYDNTWGDRLLNNRLKVVGKNLHEASDWMESKARAVSKAMGSPDTYRSKAPVEKTG